MMDPFTAESTWSHCVMRLVSREVAKSASWIARLWDQVNDA
jgi:hypothetical protein